VALGRRTFEGFIKEAIRRAKKRPGKPDLTNEELAVKLGTTATSVSRWASEKPSGTGIEIENLRSLLKLAGHELGDCMYFPDEVSHLRAVEIAVYGSEGGKKPG
jgi:hypothetical protein